MKFSIKSLIICVTFLAILCGACLWSYRSGYQEGREYEPPVAKPPAKRTITRQDIDLMLSVERQVEETLAAVLKFEEDKRQKAAIDQ